MTLYFIYKENKLFDKGQKTLEKYPWYIVSLVEMFSVNDLDLPQLV